MDEKDEKLKVFARVEPGHMKMKVHRDEEE